MLKKILALGAAGLCAIVLETASAQSPPVRRFKVPLPANVTTSDDWLDAGNVVPQGYGENYARVVEAPVDVQVGPDLDQNF